MIHRIYIGIASAADTLVPVSPPTDWFGVFVVSIIGLIIAGVVGYIVHIKKTPGIQFGEAEIEKLAELLHKKQSIVTNFALHVAEPEPLVFDGITFADQPALDEYKAAKAVIDAHKPKEGS